jgi:hypothetical protein
MHCIPLFLNGVQTKKPDLSDLSLPVGTLIDT